MATRSGTEARASRRPRQTTASHWTVEVQWWQQAAALRGGGSGTVAHGGDLFLFTGRGGPPHQFLKDNDKKTGQRILATFLLPSIPACCAWRPKHTRLARTSMAIGTSSEPPRGQGIRDLRA